MRPTSASRSSSPSRSHLAFYLVFATALALVPTTVRATAMFTGLGFLPNVTSSQAYAVSADGSTVVGGSGHEAFRWTTAGGMGGIAGTGGAAYGVSGDGSTIVGDSGFVWTLSGGVAYLPPLPGYEGSNAMGVSADSSTVVGSSFYGSALPGEFPHYLAFSWTATGGMAALGFLPGGADYSLALGVSGDGSTVAGYAANASGFLEAFRWTAVDGIVGLGALPGSTRSEAYAISSDGSTIVGESGQAFRWTAKSGMVGLGTLPGSTSSIALAVSADGSVIVGRSPLAPVDSRAFVWDAAHGMRDLSQVLAAEGLDLNGWTLRQATGISADGHSIVGWGTDPGGHTEAWIAVLPGPGTDALLLTGLLGLAVFRWKRL